MRQRLGLAGLVALLAIRPAVAQDKIKIGVIVTLSGPAAALGDRYATALRWRSRTSAARWAAGMSRSSSLTMN